MSRDLSDFTGKLCAFTLRPKAPLQCFTPRWQRRASVWHKNTKSTVVSVSLLNQKITTPQSLVCLFLTPLSPICLKHFGCFLCLFPTNTFFAVKKKCESGVNRKRTLLSSTSTCLPVVSSGQPGHIFLLIFFFLSSSSHILCLSCLSMQFKSKSGDLGVLRAEV